MSNWPTNGNLTGTLSIGQGEPGKSLQYEWRGTWLGIKREDEEEYQFVDLAPKLVGGNGREIELQVGNGYIQWRYKNEEEWNNLISIDSLKGEPGPQGPKGDIGPKGEPGPQGLPGEKGEKGERGPQGEQGIQGSPGEQGPKGETGPQGPRGEQGPQGLPGEKGDKGERGPQGLPGEKGDKGDQGIQGIQGPQGLPGRDGVDGKNGIDGTNGQDGADGVTPNITIGEVITIEPSEKAEVTRKGTNKDPIFDFKIPRGRDGVSKLTRVSIEGNTLNLTTDKWQKVNMENNTTINLPKVTDFTEIHLFFRANEAFTLKLPSAVWKNEPTIEANKVYEFIFTYVDEWIGGCIAYNE